MNKQKYHIVSLKHTKDKDAYLTLWRPDSKGYSWPIAWAGEYSLTRVIDILSPNPDGSYAVPVGFLGEIVKDDEGRPCYKNTKQIRDRIRVHKHEPNPAGDETHN